MPVKKQVSFYPGPSRVYDWVGGYMQDALREGILSVNHRSAPFMAMTRKTVELLREKLQIPSNYTVLFTSSATECWEIIAQSLVTEGSLHFYNGAFGQKWLDYTLRLKPGSMGLPFDLEGLPEVKAAPELKPGAVVALTHNETSNGTALPQAMLKKLRRKFARQIIAIDATSSLGGVALDFSLGDVWFASVQKCFGLPAGLGLMICSPRAVRQAKENNDGLHYNNLVFLLEMMAKYQTSYTPNVLGIYLLGRLMEQVEPIEVIAARLEERHNDWITFTNNLKYLTPLVGNEKIRSVTVLPLCGEAEVIAQVKSEASSKGILLGEGYGSWKESTFRIANFPALQTVEIARLKKVLAKF